MTMTLETQPIDADPDAIVVNDDTPPEGGPRLCACGCGEPLREGAKRAFLRGHKARMDAENVGPDPDPSDAGSRKSYSRRISAKIEKEIQETVEAYVGMLATMWSFNDPICGDVALSITPNIAEKAVPLLARNPKIVSYLTKGNSFKEIMDFMIAIAPLVKVAYAHHFSKTITMNAEQEVVPNYNEYTA